MTLQSKYNIYQCYFYGCQCLTKKYFFSNINTYALKFIFDMIKVHKTITINPTLQAETADFLRDEGLNFSSWVDQALTQALFLYREKKKRTVYHKIECPEEFIDSTMPITDLYDFNTYQDTDKHNKKARIRLPNSFRQVI
jgi:hypothetical protein